MINSHIHIDFENLLPIAENATVIAPSIGRQNWESVLIYPYFALGIHPWFVEQHTQADLDTLEYFVKCNNPIAIGECGLDYAKDIDKKTQVDFFTKQLALAQKYDLPVIIHSVKATEDIIFLLKKYPKVKGEIHGFSGSLEQANVLVNMGFMLGFGLQATNPKSSRIKNIIKSLPLEKILIETDDHPNPNDLNLVANSISQIKQIPLSVVTEQCDNNAINLFNLK